MWCDHGCSASTIKAHSRPTAPSLVRVGALVRPELIEPLQGRGGDQHSPTRRWGKSKFVTSRNSVDPTFYFRFGRQRRWSLDIFDINRTFFHQPHTLSTPTPTWAAPTIFSAFSSSHTNITYEEAILPSPRGLQWPQRRQEDDRTDLVPAHAKLRYSPLQSVGNYRRDSQVESSEHSRLADTTLTTHSHVERKYTTRAELTVLRNCHPRAPFADYPFPSLSNLQSSYDALERNSSSQ